nr:Ig-like domain-containing protein [uncultured Cohaesibacter sp.]
MADTKAPDLKAEATQSKFEANRVQQTMQKAEAQRASDYDTGDHLALRQDILNPNLHYGLANEDEMLLPLTQSGDVQSGVADTGSGPAVTGDGSSFPSTSDGTLSSPSASSGPSAPEEIAFVAPESQRLSINNAPTGTSLSQPDLGGEEPLTIATAASKPIDGGSASGGSMPPAADATQDVNHDVEAIDSRESVTEGSVLDSSVTATDLDGDSITYSLDGQPSEGAVSLNADGSYSFNPGSDFDDLAVGESRTVSFSFTADDGHGSTDQGTVTIEVTGTNDAPTAIDLSASTVDENAAGAVIGTLSTTDVDVSDTHSYAVSDDRFEVVEDGSGNMVLQLKDGMALDHESEPTVTVTVSTNDGNGGTFDQDFTISVNDLNEAVTADDASETTAENVTLDSSVTATDLDGDSITYSLDGQPSEGSVSLNADGSYSFNPGSDFDDLAVGESRTVSFSFTADDGNGSTDQGTVTIEVTGTNDAPTAIDLSASTVDENAAGAVIGTLSTTDVDVSDTHSYAVSDDRFEVVEDGSGNMVLQLKDGVALDHESEATVSITVSTNDGNGGTFDQDFTISVNDLNEAVTADDASETTAENATLDSSVTATDLDGDTITYSLDGQPSEGSVSLNADGSYSFNPGSDFDDLAVGESRTVSFSFTADDGNGSTDQGTVTIEVTGTNDAPTAVILSDSLVDENDAGAVIGTLTTTDVDASDTHSYTVSDDRFEVVEDGSGTMVLQLKDGVALDHESEPTVTVTVTSTDTNGASVAEDFTISVNDLNEAVTADDASETTAENVTLDSSVTATDLDGDTITYSLDGQPSEGSVSLNTDGSYSFTPGSDFDDLAVGESRTVSFSFTADDGHGSTDQGTVTIEVTGTNDAPTAIDLSASTVDENAARAVIGTLSTTDVDVSDSHSYAVSDDRFEVVEDGSGNMVLQLKDGMALDHESEATVSITVSTNDGNGGTFDQDFTISVNDLNEAVTADDASETTAENATLDSSVTATDLDGDTITYSLDGQPSEGSVSLNADGSYSFNPGSDFDDLAVGESRTVSFSFTADDGNGSTDQGTVTIEVTGTNDAPTAVILSDSLVDENDAGAVIGTLTTTDVDASDTHSYTVSDDRFEVVEDGSGTMVLQLKDGVALDHESEPTVTVTVTSTDTNGASVAEDFTISVNDLNEAVTADDASETTAENVTLDSSVTATDLDGDTITYSLDGQPSEGSVSLNTDGSYSFTPGSDFDDLAVGESRTVSFSFTADDGHGSTDQGTVTIEVTGTNDAPTAIDLSASTVDENAAGAVIGTLSTTDADASDSHSYAVSDDRFEVVEDGSGNMVLQLKDGVALDHESEPTVTVTVTSTDINGASVAEDFTISVNDLNEAVTADDASETTSENVTLDSSVTATDLDGDSITYSLDGQPSEGSVSLNADGSYSFNPGSDFDDLAVGESRTVSFRFTADDGRGSTDQGTVTIEVTGTNDAPTAIDLSASTVDENAAGAVIGTLSTTDVDVSDTHSYTVSDDRFEVVEDGSGNMVLQLKDGVALDHESEATVTVTVTSTDINGASVAEDFTISVNDLNEAVTADDTSETTAENVTLDSTVTATDLDGDSITYSLDGQPSEGAVSLNADGSYSFTPGSDFDDLAVGESRTVSFSFTADDGNGSTDQGTVTIEVTGTNDAPTAIDLSASTVDENAAGAVIGTLSTTDVDVSDTHSYTVSDDRFEVVEDGSGTMVLQLKDGVALDHESEPTVTVTVTSTDGHGGTVDQDFTINVADVNEQITAYDSAMGISEDVISVDSAMFAEDPDGDPGIFTILTQPSSGTVTTTGEVSEFGAYTLGKFNFVPGDDFNDLAEGETRTVSFDYQVEDGNGSVDTGTVSIQVTGTNDAPTAVILSDSLVDENDAGAVIGTLSTTDVDTSDTHSYTVSDDRFEVVEDGSGNMVLQLKDGVSLDYESEPTVTITITTDDGHGGSYSDDFTINVSNIMEGVTASDEDGTTTEDDVLNSVAHASSAEGANMTYVVSSQPSEGSVVMQPDGSYTFNPENDFQDLAHDESRTVSFEYTATDANGATDTGTVTILVTGTNDAPTAIDLSASTVDENATGAVIGTLSTTDVDTSDSHSYTVSDDRFEVVEDGSGNMVLQLKDGVALDHESEATVNIAVTTTDNGGLSHSQSFTIAVNDLNESPSLDASGSYNFLYNGSFEVFNGGVHGGGDGTGWYEDAYIDGWAQSDIDIHEAGHRNLGATDGAYHVDLAETSNGTLSREMEGLEDGSTYSLSIDLKSRGATGDGISGTVEDALGQSIVQVVWNGEVIATIDPAVDGFGWHTYTLGLTAGSGDGSNSITFVEVGSENSFGTLIDNVQITDSDGYGVLENEAGAEIAVLSVADPDAGDSFSYSVSDSRFEVVSIDGDTVLKLVDGVSLDYETASHVSVDVTVTDSGGLSDTQTLDIQVGDIDDTASYNTITGNNCCNTLNGTSVDDNISGLGGNDTINAYAGDDLVYGGTGADTINGGDGNDDIYGGADNDTISGGEGNDFINGEDGADTIYGNAGLDSLHGEAGDDRIYGGDGGDTIYGGEDNDSLYGEAGNDGIYGGSGNDYISGGTGDDYLVGGEGDDTFYYLVGDGNDVIDGGSAGDWTDSLVILASDGSDTTTYGTDWTITLTTGTATMVDGSDQMVLSNDATGTIDFSDGGHIELENIDRVSW